MHLRSSLQAVLPAALAALALSACDAKRTAVEAPPDVTVAVEPAAVVVPAGGTFQFAVVVHGTADTAVTWSVVEAGGGTVDATGVYTAPTVAGTYTVQATSHANKGKKGTGKVTVPPPGTITVAIAPTSGAVDACKTATFTATVTGTLDTAVTWSVQEGAAGGSVSSGGVYTAPSTAGTYHVVATSAASAAAQATVPVVVSDRIVGVAVNPPTVTVLPNGTAQFTATVTTSCGSYTAQQVVAISR